MTKPILIDRAAAAAYAQVDEQVIRQWATRGKLTRYGTPRARLYDAHEVAAIIATRRSSPRVDPGKSDCHTGCQQDPCAHRAPGPSS